MRRNIRAAAHDVEEAVGVVLRPRVKVVVRPQAGTGMRAHSEESEQLLCQELDGCGPRLQVRHWDKKGRVARSVSHILTPVAAAMGTTLLLNETNPYGTWTAVVEDDGRTVYLYLNPAGESHATSRAVWVRNLVPAPTQPDSNAMKNGQAPLLQAEACRHPDGLGPLKSEELDIVWFQEGNAVALFLDGQPEALIPPWSGMDGFFGYAAEAIGADVGTMPFPEDRAGLQARLDENLAFWTARSQGNFWSAYRDRMLAHYEAVYGPHRQYFAVTDRDYPPLAVVEFESHDEAVYVTLGMSGQHMPDVELYEEEPQNHVRSELVWSSPTADASAPGLLARVALYPWLASAYLGPGHLYRSGMDGTDRAYILFTQEFPIARPAPFDSDGYPVRFLYSFPVGDEWLQVARTRGTEHVLSKLRSNE